MVQHLTSAIVECAAIHAFDKLTCSLYQKVWGSQVAATSYLSVTYKCKKAHQRSKYKVQMTKLSENN